MINEMDKREICECGHVRCTHNLLNPRENPNEPFPLHETDGKCNADDCDCEKFKPIILNGYRHFAVHMEPTDEQIQEYLAEGWEYCGNSVPEGEIGRDINKESIYPHSYYYFKRKAV